MSFKINQKSWSCYMGSINVTAEFNIIEPATLKSSCDDHVLS